MVDLRTPYLGLLLKNPLVPSASPLSRSLDTARQLEDYGAAAIVMYSLFEEEIMHEEENMARFMIEQEIGHAEADSFLPFHHQFQRGVDQYLEQLATLKQQLEIPVIASLNGVSLGGWVEHARMLEQAGADALELNVYYIAASPDEQGKTVENRYLELLRKVKNQVQLPVTMKLSPQFSSLPHFLQQLQNDGASGVSLFNRFYQPDIDLETLSVTPNLQLSHSGDALLAMRWIALLYGRTNLSLAATGGVHSAEDAIKLVLAGADVVHLCSALLQHGPRHLQQVLTGLTSWLEQSEYGSLADMKGTVSQLHARDPSAFERANYLWVLDSYSPGPGVMR
jgi:dihydroorotate dehydrogenase (fumarate)